MTTLICKAQHAKHKFSYKGSGFSISGHNQPVGAQYVKELSMAAQRRGGRDAYQLRNLHPATSPKGAPWSHFKPTKGHQRPSMRLSSFTEE